ncbi:hypothetical protein AN2V17_31470 [Vallitalea sp. AN17-2]|uniref:Uncharacterized protein n=1 Tax=Vallitalea maricola TaxID=3074433 RepID=A0ACB5ULS4_9FIRM|nr:hypothetical protein AN2V17_31470 [Vallitalea sp. AN17-2]
MLSGEIICTQGMIKISSGDSIGEYGAVSHGWRTQPFKHGRLRADGIFPYTIGTTVS